MMRADLMDGSITRSRLIKGAGKPFGEFRWCFSGTFSTASIVDREMAGIYNSLYESLIFLARRYLKDQVSSF